MCLLLTIPTPPNLRSLTYLADPDPDPPTLSPLTPPLNRLPNITTDAPQAPNRILQNPNQALHIENAVSEAEQAEDQEWIQEWLAFVERGMRSVHEENGEEGVESPRPDGALRRRRLMDFFREMRVEGGVV